MKRFVIRIIIFFAIVAVFDLSFGQICQYLNSHAGGGDTKREYYAFMESKEDILIFGSSRALHHYIPSIIEDSLGLSCYNCGLDGNGIIMQYGRFKVITERYSPECIIYDIEPSFDIKTDDKIKYLTPLKPYYDQRGVDSIFWDVSKAERYKMLSNMYRYNTKFIQKLSDNIHPLQSVEDSGYKPLYGELDYEVEWQETERYSADKLKIQYFEKMIRTSLQKGIGLIFVASPYYHALTSEAFHPIKELCEKYSIPFLDFYFNPEFVDNHMYFKDSGHLNDTGANIFSSMISQILKQKIN